MAGVFADLEEIVSENVPLARYTWYKIGGPARYFIRPRSIEQLQAAARRCVENDIPIYVLGLGANLLVRDEGVNGAVFRLSDEFWRRIRFEKNTLVAGAGVDMQKLILRATRQSLGGLEVLAGIPGTIGGGVRMNAGGKFGDIGSLVTRVTVMDVSGMVFERTRDDLVFDYRKTNITAKFILDATLELEEDDPQRIAMRLRDIWTMKRNSQPLNTRSAGCIFKNPRGMSAGALIDQTGLKGTRVGLAEVSEKHANFVIARPGCTAADVLALIDLIRQRVQEKHGVWLEQEVEIWPPTPF
mgnify:CR=1 FL=1